MDSIGIVCELKLNTLKIAYFYSVTFDLNILLNPIQYA